MIPNHFHFVFGLDKQREPFHLAHYLCLESCRRINNPEAICFYYHYEPHGPYWEAIRPYLTLEKVSLNAFVRRFRYRDSGMRQFRYAHHSDFIRLEKLIERGGVYSDIDTLFVRPLPAAIFDKPFVMGREGDVRHQTKGTVTSLCNAFLMSARNAEFGRLWLDQMSAEFDGSWSNHSTLFPRRLADQFPDLIHIEPQRSFFHFPASGLGLDMLFEGLMPVPEGVYSIHLWAHLWWSESRVDFSRFHAGMLTRRFVEEEKTTYSVAARPFLPAASLEVPESRRAPWKTGAKRIAQGWNLEARSFIGLAVYPLLRRHSTKAEMGLRLARGYQAYKQAAAMLTVRNGFEAAIVRHVIQWDEYEIFGSLFDSQDVVVDVGGHIGIFAAACHWLGSRSIHSFEADPDNFALLKKNMAVLPDVTPYFGAVFRSDIPALEELVHSGPVFSNTGGGGVVFGGNLFEHLGFDAPKADREPPRSPVLSLDTILSRFDRVRILKLDCEGSEYPILLTSTQLHRVERIVGEYHVIPEESMPLLIPEARLDGHRSYGAETLQRKLEADGFEVSITPLGVQGLFNAVRPAPTNRARIPKRGSQIRR